MYKNDIDIHEPQGKTEIMDACRNLRPGLYDVEIVGVRMDELQTKNCRMRVVPGQMRETRDDHCQPLPSVFIQCGKAEFFPTGNRVYTRTGRLALGSVTKFSAALVEECS